jgi:hypothetical protein
MNEKQITIEPAFSAHTSVEFRVLVRETKHETSVIAELLSTGSVRTIEHYFKSSYLRTALENCGLTEIETRDVMMEFMDLKSLNIFVTTINRRDIIVNKKGD